MAVSRPSGGSGFRPLSALVLVLLSGAVIYQCLGLTASLARNGDIGDLAAQLEQGLAPEREYLGRFQADRGLDRPTAECDDNLTRSILTIDLQKLSADVAAKDEKAIKSANRVVLDFVRHRLTCNPLDGNAWLRYANALVREKGVVPEALDALQVSHWTAPSEEWIMEARIPFASYLYLKGVSSVESGLVADLRLFVQYKPSNEVAESYGQAPPAIQKLVHPLIASLPDPRKQEVLAALDNAGVVFDPK